MDEDQPSQSTPLLHTDHSGPESSHTYRHARQDRPYDADVESILSSHLSKGERALHYLPLGERLPYNDYATIDWLHDLVKDSVRTRTRARSTGIRSRLAERWDAAQGWVAAFLIGAVTALIAFAVDVSVATIADWKDGYCARSVWLDQRGCCAGTGITNAQAECRDWRPWSLRYAGSYAMYVAFAVVFGVVAGAVTLTTQTHLPAVSGVSDAGERAGDQDQYTESASGKMMYMAAGSGIPEIKTILSGFVIPHFLDFKVLLVKAIGATFAVATGMCLGKEGPFVHISTCVGYLIASCFPKYRENQRKMREMLSVACSAGLSVAFGAPIGGVLFSYEVSHDTSGSISCEGNGSYHACRKSAHTSPAGFSGELSSARSSPLQCSRN